MLRRKLSWLGVQLGKQFFATQLVFILGNMVHRSMDRAQISRAPRRLRNLLADKDDVSRDHACVADDGLDRVLSLLAAMNVVAVKVGCMC